MFGSIDADDDESVDGLSESVAILEMDLEKITKYDCEQQILLVHQPALQSLELRKQEFNEVSWSIEQNHGISGRVVVCRNKTL